MRAPHYRWAMRPRRVLPLLALCGLALAPAAARAQEQPRIARGVSAGGVDLGGLTVEEATAKLRADAEIARRLGEPLVLGAAGIAWKLTAAQARLRLDARATAARAAKVPAPESPPAPAAEGAAPGPAAVVDVPLVLTHSRAAVRAFVERVARGSWRPPRSARLRMTLRHMLVRKQRRGYRLNKRATTRKVQLALSALDERVLHQRLLRVRPKRTVADLRRAYPAVITVDRDNFRLRLFKGLRISRRYRIAVGMPGLATPRGRYRILNKRVNPAWYVPDRAWAGSLRGQVIPGGAPNNPLTARWLGVTGDGIGIHGTSDVGSIGTRASHGCIRMAVPDVLDLYRRVAIGTPVLIG